MLILERAVRFRACLYDTCKAIGIFSDGLADTISYSTCRFDKKIRN